MGGLYIAGNKILTDQTYRVQPYRIAHNYSISTSYTEETSISEIALSKISDDGTAAGGTKPAFVCWICKSGNLTVASSLTDPASKISTITNIDTSKFKIAGLGNNNYIYMYYYRPSLDRVEEYFYSANTQVNYPSTSTNSWLVGSSGRQCQAQFIDDGSDVFLIINDFSNGLTIGNYKGAGCSLYITYNNQYVIFTSHVYPNSFASNYGLESLSNTTNVNGSIKTYSVSEVSTSNIYGDILTKFNGQQISLYPIGSELYNNTYYIVTKFIYNSTVNLNLGGREMKGSCYKKITFSKNNYKLLVNKLN